MSTDFAYKVLQPPTGVTGSASGYVTHLKLTSRHPNLVLVSSNVLEVFTIRVSSADKLLPVDSDMDGVSGATLELTCSMRLYDYVDFVHVLPSQSVLRTDKIIVVYDRARISVFEFDYSLHKLVLCKFINSGTSILLIEPPMLQSDMLVYWERRPLTGVDPKGRCAAIVIYGLTLMLLQVSNECVDETRKNMKYQSYQFGGNVIDFIFVDGDGDALLYTLRERDSPDVGVILCAHGVSATLEIKLLQMPLIDLPNDAYKLFGVSPPYGGFIVVCSKMLVYVKSGAQSCQLDLKNLGLIDFFTCLRPDLILLSTKAGGLSYLQIVHDGYCTVQRLELYPGTPDAFLTAATALGENFFFLGSRLERRLKQFHWKSMIQYKDRDRDSLMTIGPLKDFVYLREKTAQIGLVCCSSHGKDGFLYKLHFSIRPTTVFSAMCNTMSEGCTGLWTLYDNMPLGEAEQNHAWIFISYESYTEVVHLDRVFLNDAEKWRYPGRSINAGNLFGRRGTILIQPDGYTIFRNGTSSYQMAPVEISNATILENYVLLLLNGGHIQLLYGDPSTLEMTPVTRLDVVNNNLITACTLFHNWGTSLCFRSLGGVEDNVFLVLSYKNGTLKIYDLPQMRCIFSVDRFVSGRSCIGDNVPDDYQRSFQKDMRDTNNILSVVELAMHKWLGENSRPFLFAILCDGTILCYRGFDYDNKLRFSRVDFDYTKGKKTQNQRIMIFEKVGDCKGLFLSGSRPTWIMQSRGRLRIHPQLCDGPIYAFAAVHTSYCKEGFIYASKGAVKLCKLPPLCYDHHWPVQKVRLKGIPRKIVDLRQPNLYSLIISTDGKDEVCICDIENGRLRALPIGTEKPCCITMVKLHDTTTSKEFLAVGTVDQQNNGGSIVLVSLVQDVIQSCSTKMMGAVSALASVDGNLLVASGTDLILLRLTGSVLCQLAKYGDTPLGVVNMFWIEKGCIIITDAERGVYLVHLLQDGPQVEVVDKMLGGKCLSSALLGSGFPSIIISDDEKKVQIHSLYRKEIGEAWFYMGTNVTQFLNILKPKLVEGPREVGALFCTEDGSIGCFTPLQKSLASILRSIQIKLLAEIPHIHGSDNKRVFLREHDASYHWEGEATMIDQEVLSHYNMLPFERQAELANEVEMPASPSEIISVLDNIILDTRLF